MNEYAAFRLIEEPKSFHLPHPITSSLSEKSDTPILESTKILPTFERPDQAICLWDEVVKMEFISDLTAVISFSTAVPFPSKAELNRARTR